METIIPGRKTKTPTGINGLDLALDGGFLPGTAILVIGSATSGSERFARQFWSTSPVNRQFIMFDGRVEDGMRDGVGLSPEEAFAGCHTGGVVIDSLSSLIITYGIEALLPILSDGCNATREGQDHLFCTLYPGLHHLYDEIRIIRLFDIVIALYDQIHGNEVIHTLDVKKIIGSPPPGRVLPFIITDKGIELSTTSRVV